MTQQALDEYQGFLDSRRQGIGATDAAAILNASPWATPFDVYSSKVEEQEATEPSLPMWLGLQIQSTVAALYSKRTGIRLRAVRKQKVHPQFDWMRCHLDYAELGNPKHLVECKTTSNWDEWGPQGSQKIPPHYWIQVQHEMAVTGAESCTIATLFGLRDFRWYEVARDDEFITRLIAAEEEFWSLHVVPRNPPPIDGSPAARRYLRRQHPADNGMVRPATPEQELLANRYRIARHNAAQAAEALAVVENQMIEVVGGDAGLKGSDFQFTYKKDGKGKVSWKGVAGFQERLLEEVPQVVLAEPFRRAGFAEMSLPTVLKAAESLYTGEPARRVGWSDYKSEVEP